MIHYTKPSWTISCSVVHPTTLTFDIENHGFLMKELIAFSHSPKNFGYSVHGYYEMRSDFGNLCCFKDFFENHQFIEINLWDKIGYGILDDSTTNNNVIPHN